jgi:hypothetical protein
MKLTGMVVWATTGVCVVSEEDVDEELCDEFVRCKYAGLKKQPSG